MLTPDVEEFIRARHGRLAPPPGVRGDDDEAFNRLALAAFARQVESVPLYGRLAALRGVDPARVRHWSEIPAAPADLFKEDLGRAQHEAAATFLSSGTTAGTGARSRHDVDSASLALYRSSSLAHFAAMALPDTPGALRVLVLAPSSTTHPNSSLGHMMDFICEEHGAERLQALGADGVLDLEAALAWLADAASRTGPVLVLAISSALTSVFEALRARGLALRLPADSRLVDTGGAKGGRTMSRAGLLKAAWRFLHIPAYLCVSEYGMTEMLSQFWDDAWHSRWSGMNLPRSKAGPAWTRTLVVDPATLQPVAPGERGLLRHLDLANAASVCALQTLDVGVARGRGFEVLGRAGGAEARGCSQLLAALVP